MANCISSLYKVGVLFNDSLYFKALKWNSCLHIQKIAMLLSIWSEIYLHGRIIMCRPFYSFYKNVLKARYVWVPLPDAWISELKKFIASGKKQVFSWIKGRRQGIKKEEATWGHRQVVGLSKLEGPMRCTETNKERGNSGPEISGENSDAVTDLRTDKESCSYVHDNLTLGGPFQ